MTKSFRGDFNRFLHLLHKNEPFAFARFSDGELRILQNKALLIQANSAFVNGSWQSGKWGEEEFKSFIPEKDKTVREYLTRSLEHKQTNYFKGVCCRCCVGDADYNWQFTTYGLSTTDPNITWANVLINANYPLFVEQMLPVMKKYPTVYVCNKKANLTKFPLNLVKDFRIGNNCHTNDIGVLGQIQEWMRETKPTGHLFLFSAASLSNLLVHELYKEFPNNTYMDIGSTLNPMLDMDGWVGSRGYLRGYWMKQPDAYSTRECVW